MIRTFTVTAPLGERDPAATIATLQAATGNLIRLYPGMRSASCEASEGILTLTIRVTGTDRWRCAARARKIGTNMLVRAKISAEQASMVLMGDAPTARSLDKGNGRNISGHKPRGPQYLRGPQEDPS